MVSMKIKESKSGREFAQVALLLHFNQQGRMKGTSQGEWGVLCLSQTRGYPDVLEELGRNSKGHYKLPTCHLQSAGVTMASG